MYTIHKHMKLCSLVVSVNGYDSQWLSIVSESFTSPTVRSHQLELLGILLSR